MNRQNYKNKKVVIIMSVFVLLITISTALLLNLKNKQSQTKDEPVSSLNIDKIAIDNFHKKYNQTNNDNQQLESDYEYISSKNKLFSYHIKELDDETIIFINDEIIKDLTDQKKIDPSNDSYTIFYFTNRQIAKDYLDKMTSPDTKNEEKLLMATSCYARMSYQKETKTGSLFNLKKMKEIKNYK